MAAGGPLLGWTRGSPHPTSSKQSPEEHLCHLDEDGERGGALPSLPEPGCAKAKELALAGTVQEPLCSCLLVSLLAAMCWEGHLSHKVAM